MRTIPSWKAPSWKVITALWLGLSFALVALAQSDTDQQTSQASDQQQVGKKHQPGAVREIGAGAGTAGVGAAKGGGEAAKGVGKGALDLVTLHPINAAGSVGKGAAVGGKDVAVGTVKGTGKVTRGIGRAFKNLF